MLNIEERRLVQALRSGAYKQARRQLRVGNSFCCLGVQCDISGSGKWNDMTFEVTTRKGTESCGDVLPTILRKRLGWNSDTGDCTFMDRDYSVVTLAGMNDDGFSFSEIADVIAAGLVCRAKRIRRAKS